MRTFYFITVSFASCIILMACDPYVRYTQIIDNRSDHDLWLNFHSNYKMDSILIFKNQMDTVFENSHIGTVNSYKGCEAVMNTIQDIRVAEIDSLDVSLDVRDPGVWDFSIIEHDGGGGGTCECRLVIRNEDIK